MPSELHHAIYKARTNDLGPGENMPSGHVTGRKSMNRFLADSHYGYSQPLRTTFLTLSTSFEGKAGATVRPHFFMTGTAEPTRRR